MFPSSNWQLEVLRSSLSSAFLGDLAESDIPVLATDMSRQWIQLNVANGCFLKLHSEIPYKRQVLGNRAGICYPHDRAKRI